VTLRTRFFLGGAGIVLVVATTAKMVADRLHERAEENEFAAELEREANLVAAGLDPRAGDLNAQAHGLARLIGRRVTLVDMSGTALGDSDFDDASLQLLGNHRDRPEIAAAFGAGTGRATRLSASTNQVELKVAVRAWPGVVRVSAPVAQVRELVRERRSGSRMAWVASVAFGMLLVWMGAVVAARPVERLAAATRPDDDAEVSAASGIPEVREVAMALRAAQHEVSRRESQIRKERAETDALIASVSEGVLLADERGEVVVCNDATRRLLGFEPEAPMPNLRELFHQREARDVVDRVLGGTAIAGREIAVAGHTILVTGLPLPRGGAVLGLLDVTDLRRLEAVRRDFVANVSHELKTPLTSIRGYAETLLHSPADTAINRGFLETLHENAVRMQRLIDDLLDLARIESGSWEPRREPVLLARAAAEAWEAMGDRIGTRTLRYVTDIPERLTIAADRDAVRQILTNLYDNAIRHTPDGGTITTAAAGEGDGVALYVRDTGSGIAGEHLPRVFERFYRADPARSRQEGGTGLGLAIVRHLVEAHGGIVTIESTLGRGTQVRMFFPQ
jgi:two-component system phosphate regulon sensor histidine kinase PhoR